MGFFGISGPGYLVVRDLIGDTNNPVSKFSYVIAIELIKNHISIRPVQPALDRFYRLVFDNYFTCS